MIKLALGSLGSLALAALVACSSAPPDPASTEGEALRHRGGGNGSSSGSSSGGPTAPGTGAAVACGNQGDPSASCASPEHCCFGNYTAAHDGYCTTAPCFYGTIDCDGPEDCAAGEVCCMSALSDPVDGTLGYAAACQTDACGATALEHELCHPGGAPCADAAATCVTAAGNDADLPADLAICL